MIQSFNDKTPRIADSAFISKAAFVIGDVEIGENSSVWVGAAIRGDFGKIIIGKNTVIEDNCFIQSPSPASSTNRDVFIGENVLIEHGAVSYCHKIGDNVLIGMNSIVKGDVEIGNYCIIAAGCIINEKIKIPDWSFVDGVPGEIKGKVSSEQQRKMRESLTLCLKLSKQYKLEGL
jgi:carbonic anhydrase/acetyltransferase-like protein (isoleucine patch superfamily)